MRKIVVSSPVQSMQMINLSGLNVGRFWRKNKSGCVLANVLPLVRYLTLSIEIALFKASSVSGNCHSDCHLFSPQQVTQNENGGDARLIFLQSVAFIEAERRKGNFPGKHFYIP